VTLIFKRIVTVFLLVVCALPFGRPVLAQTLVVHSATDTPAMRPLIEAFEARTPGAFVDYVEFQTRALYQSMLTRETGALPDVVISSAIDLQVDLVNRGLALRIQLPPQIAPPP
jgi:two-component system sensor histidine kinase TctE